MSHALVQIGGETYIPSEEASDTRKGYRRDSCDGVFGLSTGQ